jgi:hypothetical protein
MAEGIDEAVDEMLGREMTVGRVSFSRAAFIARNIVQAEVAALTAHDIGLFHHQNAVRLGESNRVDDAALEARHSIRHFREAASRSDPRRDLYEWCVVHCDLCSSLVLLGEFATDADALREAISMAADVLSRTSSEGDRFAFVRGATMNNLGHAQFRLGVITDDVDGVRRGTVTLTNAIAHFQRHGFDEAAESTERLLCIAKAAGG